MERRDEPIELPFFSDSYIYSDTVFESDTTKIFIIKHTHLGDERIMKLIAKPLDDTGSIGAEAEILKGLKHPGIPILYDYAEDDESICLIEEFVRGLSLEEYFLHYPFLSKTQIITYIIQLCDILSYLHEPPVSILYQDLKPEHIIIRGDQIMLIDYGISEFLTGSGQNHHIAGTVSYMAPEAFTGKSDERRDIYALGLIAKEMFGHCGEKIPASIEAAVFHAIKSDPGERPSSVREWKSSWELNLKKEEDAIRIGKHRLNTVAVLGSQKGVGCTHIAISLTSYLNKAGMHAYYLNVSGEAVCEHILAYGREYREEDGLIYHGAFRGMLRYFADRKGHIPPDGVRILDCGTEESGIYEADLVVYIMGSRLWNTGEIDAKIAKMQSCFLLVNPVSMGQGLWLAKETGKKVYGFPLDNDPFYITKEKRKLFKKLIREWEFVS
ncbi:MAG: protein kinase [Lachnospiraceae bacterium]|nr:protein kinase [Lachnospiraceae bacterium]